MLVLTGQRPGEIITLRWDEVFDIDTDFARLEFGPERTKNGKRHTVPLPLEARAIIAEAKKALVDSDFVFPSFRNPGEAYDVRSFARAMKRVIKGLPASEISLQLKVNAPTPHDLRRTMATGLSRLGVSREVRKAVINHSESDVHAVYDRYERFDEKLAALIRWESHVVQTVGHRGDVKKAA